MSTPALRQRYPEHFGPVNALRLRLLVLALGMSGLFVFGLVQLDFSLLRIVNGMSRLGKIVVLMLPPDPGWGRFFGATWWPWVKPWRLPSWARW